MEMNDTTKSMHTLAYIHTYIMHILHSPTLKNDGMLVLVFLFADIDLFLETER